MAVKSPFADGLYIALLEHEFQVVALTCDLCSADQIQGINNCVVWIILEKYIIDVTNKIFFLFFFNSQVSHDFAVNFNEDNPECAGMIEHSFQY